MILDSIFYIYIFIFGLIVGSFLNCVIYRLSAGESLCFSKKSNGEESDRVGLLFERSHCPACNHILSWLDLIPVLSFFVLKGSCRYCRQKISWRYPIVELTTGLLFVLIFWILDFGFDLAFGFWILDLTYYLLISSFLIIIFDYDLQHYIIPDEIIYSAIGVTFLYSIVASFCLPTLNFQGFNFFHTIAAAFGASAFFLFLVLVSQGRWMGMGDVKLAFFMGLFLSWPNIIVALFSAFMFGAIIGVGLIAVKRKGLKSEIPFGPFLVTGTFIALFFGEKIISWYLNIFI